MSEMELFLIEREYEQPELSAVMGEILRQMEEAEIGKGLLPGARVAITAGSRGIARMPEILALLVSFFRRAGAEPFIVPAMGSHGGATARGQVGVLEALGITQGTVGAPIRSSMDVVELGTTDQGCPVFMDRIASESDAIFVVNRVKVHTRFKAEHESGLVKMIAVGLGKQRGCTAMHHFDLYPAILDACRISISRAPIIGGLGIVENASKGIARLGVAGAGDIERLDAELLSFEKELFPRLPVEDLDLLVVDEMGKNISGTGMDTNVIGRVTRPCMNDDERPRIKKIVVLDLNGSSRGNALGMGLADITTDRFREKIDFQATYANAIAANVLERVKMPVMRGTDREAIELGLRLIDDPRGGVPRIIHIRNTLDLSRMVVSRAVLDEMEEKGMSLSRCERAEMDFDEKGNLIAKW